MAIATTLSRNEFNTGKYGWINLHLASTTGIGAQAVTQTGTTTNASPTVTGLGSTANLNVGQPVSGTGIPAGATILSIDSATQIHLSTNATASGTPSLTFSSTPLTVAGDLVVAPYQELPNLQYKCRITTAPYANRRLIVRIGDTVTG